MAAGLPLCESIALACAEAAHFRQGRPVRVHTAGAYTYPGADHDDYLDWDSAQIDDTSPGPNTDP